MRGWMGAAIAGTAILTGPVAAQTYSPVSECLLYAKSHDAIVAACTRAIGSSATSKVDRVGAYRKRGSTYSLLKDYDRAIADLTEAIRQKPTDADAFYERGLTYRMKTDYGRAISDLTQALRLKPDDGDYYLERAHSHHAKKDYDRAIADYTVAIQLNPSNEQLFQLRGARLMSSRAISAAPLRTIRSRSDFSPRMRPHLSLVGRARSRSRTTMAPWPI